MFADYILMFSNSPSTDLMHLKGTLDCYRQMAGLKINHTKSEILLLTHLKTRKWLQDSPFAIATKQIKYLGIIIGNTPDSIYSLNYNPLIAKITKELHMLRDLPLSLKGRIHLYKMVSFAKLFYPLQTILIMLIRGDIAKLNMALSRFLWCSKKNKINLDKLCFSKGRGGYESTK